MSALWSALEFVGLVAWLVAMASSAVSLGVTVWGVRALVVSDGTWAARYRGDGPEARREAAVSLGFSVLMFALLAVWPAAGGAAPLWVEASLAGLHGGQRDSTRRGDGKKRPFPFPCGSA